MPETEMLFYPARGEFAAESCLRGAVSERAVLKAPTELAPSGIYIMRIHGTFVNFLDLSPAIQEDIIQRLEAGGHAA